MNATYVVLLITTTIGGRVVHVINPLASSMTMMGVNDTNFLVMESNLKDYFDYDDYVIPRDAVNLMSNVKSL